MRSLSWLLLLAVACGCADGRSSAPREPDPFAQAREEVRRALEQPVPKGNVKIHITRYEFDAQDRTRQGLVLRYRDGRVAVNAGAMGRNGVRIFAARDGLLAALSAAGRQRTREQVAKQFLLLMPGHPAHFDVLRVRREPWPVIVPVYDGYALGYTIRERITGTGLQALVHSATPTRVEVELMPYFHSVERRGRLLVKELATRLTVVPGRTYVIAADNQNARTFGRTFLSRHSGKRDSETVILLKAEVGG